MSWEKANEFTPFKIEILCTPQAVEELLPLLRHLQACGAIGHSANIVVDPDMKERKENFFFDGDGSSGIGEIRIKRLHWHECRDINTHKGRMHKDGKYWKVEENKEFGKIKKALDNIENVRDQQAKGTCEPDCQCATKKE